jgi:ParB-like chromosome segregation protein Spo0J
VKRQPLDHVTWLNPAQLEANDYNPNHVPPRELDLLATSLTETGWTQPIVTDRDHKIIDGFHRWWLACTRPEVTADSDGLVPVVTIEVDDVTRRLATIRHNRARGTHFVKQMAVLVNQLLTLGETREAVSKRLGMEMVEVDRLARFGASAETNAGDTIGQGWVARPTQAKVAR